MRTRGEKRFESFERLLAAGKEESHVILTKLSPIPRSLLQIFSKRFV